MGWPILVIDVDSTIWPAEHKYDKAALELYGKPFWTDPVPDWYDHKALVYRFGNDYWRIFDRALDPSKVSEREFYPGVREALYALYERGVGIHFLTKNFEPERMRRPLLRWLEGVAPPGFKLSLTIRDDKTPMLEKIGAYGIVDDKPELLMKARRRGYWCATKYQPWNRRVVEENPAIFGFEHWGEFTPDRLFVAV